jgi:hypothetical protein
MPAGSCWRSSDPGDAVLVGVVDLCRDGDPARAAGWRAGLPSPTAVGVGQDGRVNGLRSLRPGDWWMAAGTAVIVRLVARLIGSLLLGPDPGRPVLLPGASRSRS